jgi:uncharacterized protein with HEPN domain
MPQNKDDRAYIYDMLTAARLLCQFAEGQTMNQFQNDPMRRSAIERQIEIIGEAANRTSSEFKHQHPEIPWRKIIGQRNILAHEYDDIAVEILWNVVTIHIPQLIQQLETILPSSEIPEVEM